MPFSARGATPILTRGELPGDAGDTQSRYIEAAVNGVLIASLYAPNGNPQPGPKFDYKLAWLDRLAAHAAELYAAGVPVVLAGDYNVVPTELDIYPTKSWDDDALLQPESRAAYRRLLAQGWVDAIRTLYPAEPMYTYWDYMRQPLGTRRGPAPRPHAAERGSAGAPRIAGVDRAVRGKDDASDHAPVWVELRDAASGARRAADQITARRQSADGAQAAPAKRAPDRRPLLVIDGDSFAHRSYHALPKTILRTGKKGARRDRRLCELSAAALREREAARRAGGLGHARRADLSAP